MIERLRNSHQIHYNRVEEPIISIFHKEKQVEQKQQAK